FGTGRARAQGSCFRRDGAARTGRQRIHVRARWWNVSGDPGARRSTATFAAVSRAEKPRDTAQRAACAWRGAPCAGRVARRSTIARVSAHRNMNVRVFRRPKEAAHAAAAAVAAQLARKPASVLGLPTGRTSLGVYDELARLHRMGAADFSQ